MYWSHQQTQSKYNFGDIMNCTIVVWTIKLNLYHPKHRLQVSDPAYDDPITWKQKDSEPVDQKKDGDYINTAKCVAYRQNPTTTTTFCTLSLPSSQCRPTSQADEYEVMQQLNYKGDNYRH
jgi:hypothetical protein